MNASSRMSSAGLQFTHPYLAVVLGGGFTGMLAAAALSEHADVIVVERERLPRTPALPTDLPQPRHAHLLAADGARVVESLLPGTVERWLAEGAHRLAMPSEPTGPLPPGRPLRRARTRHVFACSRDLLDRVLREQVPALPGVTVLDGTEAEGLTGTAEHVTGVRVRDTTSGETYRLDADLVVDATGRSSTTPDRLAALGLPAAAEDVRDTGIVCATRIFRAPAGYENCPVITARSDRRRNGEAGAPAPEPPLAAARTATLVPIEGGRWLVTLTGGGPGGDAPTERAGDFVPFARRIPHTVIGDLIAGAEPLSEVRLTRDTSSHRHRYERLSRWPTGFLALGGAVASVRPDCGQGLSLAAHGAAALREALRRHGLDDPGLGRRVQRTIGGLVDAPWALATGEELPRSGVPRSPLATRFVRGAVGGVLAPDAALPPVCRAYVDVVTPAVPAACRPQPPEAHPASGAAAPAALPPGSEPAELPSTLPALFTPSAAAALAAPPPAVPGPPGPEQAPRRLPRPLGFGPTALRLRRFGGGKRKPGGG
ncbi:pyridine nucleotide-disulfide oxidoreductase [Streptomyces sp. NRRL F-4489]|uniref:FAD-dependent oxidoreductase n=1 Tax=Streptomyces sp. NRRL F-4489 TaxID=1609095 RepID=UPI0007474F56|nr:FAD-dependent monooxygenase [Streptomyces sp. NRRL F-4489]KUL54593.1 pyridine nucleotide-disulfide oxidoreductase [Streptomyces sp. NRRL F-4489]